MFLSNFALSHLTENLEEALIHLSVGVKRYESIPEFLLLRLAAAESIVTNEGFLEFGADVLNASSERNNKSILGSEVFPEFVDDVLGISSARNNKFE